MDLPAILYYQVVSVGVVGVKVCEGGGVHACVYACAGVRCECIYSALSTHSISSPFLWWSLKARSVSDVSLSIEN